MVLVAVKLKDGKVIFRIYIAFFIGIILWAPESLCGIHVLLAYQTC